MVSSSVFETTLVLEPRRSRRLTAAVGVGYALALAGVVATLDATFLPVVLPIALVAAWRDYRRLAPGPRLFWHGDGDWRRGSPDAPAWALDRSTWCSPWLIVLALRGPGGVARIPVARDSVDPAVWRRLRARLRMANPRTPHRAAS